MKTIHYNATFIPFKGNDIYFEMKTFESWWVVMMTRPTWVHRTGLWEYVRQQICLETLVNRMEREWEGGLYVGGRIDAPLNSNFCFCVSKHMIPHLPSSVVLFLFLLDCHRVCHSFWLPPYFIIFTCITCYTHTLTHTHMCHPHTY